MILELFKETSEKVLWYSLVVLFKKELLEISEEGSPVSGVKKAIKKAKRRALFFERYASLKGSP